MHPKDSPLALSENGGGPSVFSLKSNEGWPSLELPRQPCGVAHTSFPRSNTLKKPFFSNGECNLCFTAYFSVCYTPAVMSALFLAVTVLRFLDDVSQTAKGPPPCLLLDQRNLLVFLFPPRKMPSLSAQELRESLAPPLPPPDSVMIADLP